jgi:hypothetical protein
MAEIKIAETVLHRGLVSPGSRLLGFGIHSKTLDVIVPEENGIAVRACEPVATF